LGPGENAQKVDLWFALDRSREPDPHDLLYADSNGDGSLADETPLKAAQTQFEPGYERAEFELAKVLLPTEDGTTAYHLNIQYYASQGQSRVYLYSACWYEGMVTVGGKTLWCAVIDADISGRFDDTSLRYDKADCIRIADQAGEPYKGQEDTTLRVLAKHVEIDGKLYPVTVAADGSSVTFAPAVEIPTGTIRVGTSPSQVCLFGPQGFFVRQVAEGAVNIPQGEYSLVQWKASRKDDKGATWTLLAMVSEAKKAPKVTVGPGKEAALDIGEPLISTVSHRRGGEETYFNQEFKGRQGEYLRITRNGELPPAPKLRIVSRDGTYDKTFSMEYG
ncbi:MAG: hypothetical protein MUP47_01590, partial [Phycisphaerae bacterium]|nr:hypothetical protein [Phycisphaerae bacterium]